jgi:hypothetical protein
MDYIDKYQKKWISTRDNWIWFRKHGYSLCFREHGKLTGLGEILDDLKDNSLDLSDVLSKYQKKLKELKEHPLITWRDEKSVEMIEEEGKLESFEMFINDLKS